MTQFFDYSPSHADYFKKHGQLVTYKKNQYIVSSVDENPWVHFLAEGHVRVAFSFSDGSDRLIGFFLPGMSFAQIGTFFNDANGDLEYIASTPVTAYRLPISEFLLHLTKDTAFNQEYINWLLKAQILLIERIVYQGESTLRCKLLRWILFMARYYGEEQGNETYVFIPTTHATMADFLHVTRESVGKALGDIIDKKAVRIEKKHLYVDVARVQALLDQH